MESDPFQWKWRNFDCVAKIPHMLRMYLRARGQVSGPVNAPVQVIPSDSEDGDDEEEDSNPWKRVENEPDVDVKNEASTSNPEPAMKEPVLSPFPKCFLRLKTFYFHMDLPTRLRPILFKEIFQFSLIQEIFVLEMFFKCRANKAT